jgi:hypothetical protein
VLQPSNTQVVKSLGSGTRQTARVSIGGQSPAQAQNESASETKYPSDSSNARTIDCRILAENERTVELSVEAEFASDAPLEPVSGSPPLLRTPLLRTKVHVTVQLEKPTVISTIANSDGNSSFTIELTATRIREK